jgi:HPt (histidine-containing phosphotransfer) domain-containing protein
VSAPILDEADLLERLGDDAELVAEVLAVFLEDAPVRLAAIHAALAQRDAAELRAAAHALKGAAASIAAIRLFEAAQALEHTSHDGQLDGAAVGRVVSETDALVAALQARAAA